MTTDPAEQEPTDVELSDSFRDLDAMIKRRAKHRFRDVVIDPRTGENLKPDPTFEIRAKGKIKQLENQEEIEKVKKRGSGNWKLIARRGQDFLWDVGDGKGIITSLSRIVSETQLPIDSILARGYWEMVDGSESKI